jgi:CheY-like chemotaxis protein
MPLRPILVVEDCDEDFQTVQDAARRTGLTHPIVRASSGAECLREIRSDDTLTTLPLMVLSASANPRDLQFCYANGANAYHVKPVEHALHLQILQTILNYWLGSVVLPHESTNAR